MSMVSVFPDIVKDCHKMRNLPKIFLRSFQNVAQASCVRVLSSHANKSTLVLKRKADILSTSYDISIHQ